MPNKTYFNLSEEKQSRVYNALLNEFTNNTLENVSIKRIVTDAEIPRGSFYQYFTDKEDALRYLIKLCKSGEEEILIDTLEPNFDLFNLLEYIFHREVQVLKGNEISTRMKLLNQISKSQRATVLFYEELTNTILGHEMINNLIINTNFRVLSEDEQDIVLELLFSSLKEALLSIMQARENLALAESNFKLKLKIIKAGVASIFFNDVQ